MRFSRRPRFITVDGPVNRLSSHRAVLYNLASPHGKHGRPKSNQGVQAIVKNFLETQLGKEVDLTCEGATISGRITRIEGDVLWIEKEGVTCYVNIQKIVVVWEQRERKVQAPGFGARSL